MTTEQSGREATPEIQVSIVVPVYNSENTLDQLTDRVLAVLSEMDRSFEIVFVNDGSHDNSWQVLQQIRSKHPAYVTTVDLMRNFGQHNALLCGMRQSSGNILITLDDDLQNPPEEIPGLIRELELKNLDLVYGVYQSKKHSRFRNIGSQLTQRFYKFVFRLNNGVSAFRVIRRHLVDCLERYDLNFVYLDGLFAWHSNRIGQVVVTHNDRLLGDSGYSVRRLFELAINLFTNFSLLPLQIVSIAGFIVALFGFAAGAYYAVLRIFNNIEVPGFATLIIAILTIGGIQMLSIGVIGEYLGRLHLNANRKPQYVQRQVLARRQF